METPKSSSGGAGGAGGSGGGGGGGGGGGPDPSKGGGNEKEPHGANWRRKGDQKECAYQAVRRAIQTISPGCTSFPSELLGVLDWEMASRDAKLGKTGEQFRRFWDLYLDPNYSHRHCTPVQLKYVETQKLGGRTPEEIAPEMEPLGMQPKNAAQVRNM